MKTTDRIKRHEECIFMLDKIRELELEADVLKTNLETPYYFPQQKKTQAEEYTQTLREIKRIERQYESINKKT